VAHGYGELKENSMLTQKKEDKIKKETMGV